MFLIRKVATLFVCLGLVGTAEAQERVVYNIYETGETVGSNQLHWHPIVVSGGGDGVSSLESRGAYPHRFAGTFSNLGARISANTFDTGNVVFTLEVNDAPTALTFTVKPGETGWFEDTTHTVTIAADDVISITVDADTDAGSSMTIGTQWAVFSPTAAGAQYMMGSFANWTSTTGTRYTSLMGIAGSNSTEPFLQLQMKTAGTITHFQVHTTTHRTDGDSLITLRKDTADANKILTSPSMGSDDTNYVSTAGTDTWTTDTLLSAKHTTTGTGNVTYSYLQVAMDSDDDRFEMGTFGTQVASAAGAAEYVPFGSMVASVGSASEADVQIQMPIALSVNYLRAYVRVNTCTNDSTVSLRVNGSSVKTLTIAMAATGWQNLGDSAQSIAVGDKVDFEIIPCTTGTSIEVNQIVVTAEDATSTGPPTGTLNLLGAGR